MATAARWVLHLDMDAFFASVEQLTRPTLRGRPVLVGGTGPRGVVAGASYEARTFGARSAMPMHQARRLVGSAAVVLPPRFALYELVSRHVFTIVRDAVPVLEQIAYDEAFGEPTALAGADVTAVEDFCRQLRADVLDATGLVASVGAGAGKQVAKIASGLAKPDGLFVVPPGTERRLLADLPVRALWGIGPVAQAKLHTIGIDTIGALAAADVTAVLGRTLGTSLRRLAQGVDDRPVAERGAAKQVSAETTFQTDLRTTAELRSAVRASGDAAHGRLLKDGRPARTVVLKLRKADMSIVTRSATLPYSTTDRETLVATAQRLLPDPTELGPIRLVGVGLTSLSDVRQGSLFPELEREREPETEPGSEPAAVDQPEEAMSHSAGRDVLHDEHGFGWVQGTGHGVLTIRFETRTSGPGPTRTVRIDDPALHPADAELSLR